MRTIKRFLCVAFVALLCALPAEAKLTSEDAHEVWGRVAQATDLTALPFTVKEEESPNAWVTNGKSVTVTTGLLNILDDKDELYCVFAHEAGHAKLGHYQSTVNRGAGLSVATTVLGKLFGNLVGAAANVGANLAYAGWSREQEVAADDYAVKLAHEQGVDPVGMYRALSILSEKGGKTQPSGFNSHPPDERRLPHVKNEILKYEPNAQFPDTTSAQTRAYSEERPAEQPAKPSDMTTRPAEPQNGGGHHDVDGFDRTKRE